MKISVLVTAFATFLALGTTALAKETQVIAGAGPSTELAKAFAVELNKISEKVGLTFVVPENSTKHAGGIKNTETQIFGRTGRPLKDDEKKQNKEEILLGKIKAVFSVGAAVGDLPLNLQQLQDIYTKKILKWSEVGGPDAVIVTLGRDPDEAILALLKQKYPFMEKAVFDKVLQNDDQVLNILGNKIGEYSIGFGAASILKKRKIVSIKDFDASLAVGLAYDHKNKDNEYVQAAVKIAASPDWVKTITALGYTPFSK